MSGYKEKIQLCNVNHVKSSDLILNPLENYPEIKRKRQAGGYRDNTEIRYKPCTQLTQFNPQHINPKQRQKQTLNTDRWRPNHHPYQRKVIKSYY